jgi:hypothetical protein
MEAPQAGVALMSAPATVVRAATGAAVDAPVLVVARVAGAALFTIGTLCWVASKERRGLGARGLRPSPSVLQRCCLHGRSDTRSLALALTGIGLWPVVTLHAALAAWCNRMSLSNCIASALLQ